MRGSSSTSATVTGADLRWLSGAFIRGNGQENGDERAASGFADPLEGAIDGVDAVPHVLRTIALSGIRDALSVVLDLNFQSFGAVSEADADL